MRTCRRQSRASTLALWCMFAQVFPLFQDNSVFTVIPSLYKDGFMDATVRPTAAEPRMQGIIAVIALAANVLILASITNVQRHRRRTPTKRKSSLTSMTSSKQWAESDSSALYLSPSRGGEIFHTYFLLKRGRDRNNDSTTALIPPVSFAHKSGITIS